MELCAWLETVSVAIVRLGLKVREGWGTRGEGVGIYNALHLLIVARDLGKQEDCLAWAKHLQVLPQ
jgi:nitrous oxidase accessory protein NosD